MHSTLPIWFVSSCFFSSSFSFFSVSLAVRCELVIREQNKWNKTAADAGRRAEGCRQVERHVQLKEKQNKEREKQSINIHLTCVQVKATKSQVKVKSMTLRGGLNCFYCPQVGDKMRQRQVERDTQVTLHVTLETLKQHLFLSLLCPVSADLPHVKMKIKKNTNKIK